MKKFTPFIILFIIALSVWAWLGFPADFVIVATAFLAVVGAIKLIFDTAKSFEERFTSNNSQGRLFDELKQPISVRLIPLDTTPVISKEKGVLLEELRALAPSAERAQLFEYTQKILGDAAQSFWHKIDKGKSSVLNSLSQSPQMLAQLLLVFEQNENNFPENEGRLLSEILTLQFSENRLKEKRLMPLDSFETHLGRLAEWNYPTYRFPKSHDFAFPSPHSDYEDLIEGIGRPVPSQGLSFRTSFTLWILSFLFKEPRDFFEKLEKIANPWRTLLLIPVFLILDPINFLASLLLSPFIWLDRNLERISTSSEFESDFQTFLANFWDKYKQLKMILRRFVDKFNLRRIRNIRRGEAILKYAAQAGILVSDGEKIWFVDEFWRDYFAAFYIIKYDRFVDFFKSKRSSNWRRLYEGERVAVMICGLHKTPQEVVEQVLALDPALAAECFLSLESSANEVKSKLKQKILDETTRELDLAPRDGNSEFCYNLISAIRGLTDNPYYAHSSLSKLPEIELREIQIESAKIIATYGPSVYDMVVSCLKQTDPYEQENYFVILGELKDQRAIALLKELLNTATLSLTRLRAAIILATYFQEDEGIDALGKFLRFEMDDDKERNSGRDAWYFFDYVGETAVKFALNLFEEEDNPANANKYLITSEPWRGMEERFLMKLSNEYQRNMGVERLLFEFLKRSKSDRFKKLIIQAFGQIRSQSSAAELLKFLHHENDDVKRKAIDSLVLIGQRGMGVELIGLLYSHDLNLVHSALWAIASLRIMDAVPAMLEKLESQEVVLLYSSYDKIGYPLSLAAMGALVKISVGIQQDKSASEDDREVCVNLLNLTADWCYSHAGDYQPISGSYKTVSMHVLNYLDHEIPIEKAHRYYSDWIDKHPEDHVY